MTARGRSPVETVQSVLLLVGSGLFVRTMQNLKKVDVGFNTSHLVTFHIDPLLSPIAVTTWLGLTVAIDTWDAKTPPSACKTSFPVTWPSGIQRSTRE